KAGCRLSHVGIESLSQESLDSVTKGQEVDNVVDFLKRAKKAGLKIHGCFVLGLHNDTKETINQTIELAKKLPMDTIQVFPIIPYPGTSTWKWAEDNDYLTTKDYSKWLKSDGSYDCVVSRPELTNEELLELMWKFLRSWYYRPKYFGYKIGQSLTSLNEFKRNLTSFRSMLRRGL
ncbi:MAG: B12-binding domain-containing radical SAM protein, partial [Candidatus Hodarchaeales archaeon]